MSFTLLALALCLDDSEPPFPLPLLDCCLDTVLLLLLLCCPLPLLEAAVVAGLVEAVLAPTEPLLEGMLCGLKPVLLALVWSLELFPPTDLVAVVVE